MEGFIPPPMAQGPIDESITPASTTHPAYQPVFPAQQYQPHVYQEGTDAAPGFPQTGLPPALPVGPGHLPAYHGGMQVMNPTAAEATPAPAGRAFPDLPPSTVFPGVGEAAPPAPPFDFPQAEVVEPGVGDPPPPLEFEEEVEDEVSPGERALLELCGELISTIDHLREDLRSLRSEVHLLRERPPTVNLVLNSTGAITLAQSGEVPRVTAGAPVEKVTKAPKPPKEKETPPAPSNTSPSLEDLAAPPEKPAAPTTPPIEESVDLVELQKQLGGKKAWVARRTKSVEDAAAALREVQAKGGSTDDAFNDLKAKERQLDALNAEIAELEARVKSLLPA